MWPASSLRQCRLLLIAAGICAPALAAQAPRAVPLGTPDITSPEEFTRVISVRELSDGRLLVSDRRDNRVVVLDFAGRATQIGRVGSGPGEYRSAGLLIPFGGDSTAMFDGPAGRWLILSGDRPVATIAPDDPRAKHGSMSVGIGREYLYACKFPPEGLHATSDPVVSLIRISRSTGRIDTIAQLAGQSVRFRGDRGGGDRPRVVSLSISPWSAGDQALLFPDGSIGIARVDPYRVDWLMPDRTLRRGPALGDGAVPFTNAEKVAFMERAARGTGRPPLPPESRSDWPAEIPPFTSASAMLGDPSPALTASPEGHLVVRRTQTSAHPNQRYDVVDRTGLLKHQLTLRADERLIGIGARHAYTIVTDADGIQRLRRYRWPAL